MDDEYDDEPNTGEESDRPGGLEEAETRMAEQEQPSQPGPTSRRGMSYLPPVQEEGETPASGPRITPGGEPGQGDPTGDPRSRYTAEFAGGHKMEVVGGGVPGIRSGRPMPPAGGVALSRAETLRMQRLTNAQSSIQEAVSNGQLDEATGDRLMSRVRKQMGPLQRRQDAAQMQQLQQQQQMQKQQAVFEGSVANAHDTVAAQNTPHIVSQLPNGGSYTRNPKTNQLYPVPVPEEVKHQHKLEEIAATHAAQQDRHEQADYHSVHQLLTQKGKDDQGNATVKAPGHDDIQEYRARRDFGLAGGKGPMAQLEAIKKYYPNSKDAPAWARDAIYQLAHPGEERSYAGIPVPNR